MLLHTCIITAWLLYMQQGNNHTDVITLADVLYTGLRMFSLIGVRVLYKIIVTVFVIVFVTQKDLLCNFKARS